MIPLDAATLIGGGLVERLNEEMQKAVANCLDVNTEPKKTRTVSLKIKIKPDETRTYAGMSVEVSSTLCPPETLHSAIYMGMDVATGEIKASEAVPGEIPGQETLPGFEAGKAKVAMFSSNKEATC